MQMIIYCITNKVNGKQYVGQTVRSAEERFMEHARHNRTYIERTVKKYGRENFDVEVIDSALLIDDLNEKEKYWIDKLNTKKPNGYNVCDGGDNTFGFNHTLESRMKMSTTKKQLGNMVGIKNHFYGKKHSQETKERMRATQWQRKRVMNIETGLIYDSCAEAARLNGLNKNMVARVARGEASNTKGTHWKYIDDKAIS